MKFLNRKWAEDGYDDMETNLHWHVYMRHLQDIVQDLPPGVQLLAGITKGYRAMGGRVAATSFDKVKLHFHLVLELSGLFLDIKYVNAEFENFEALEAAKCILTDEVDLMPNGRFEHRVLLDPDDEFVVTFSDVEVNFAPSGVDDE